jgi:hypothetical protein
VLFLAAIFGILLYKVIIFTVFSSTDLGLLHGEAALLTSVTTSCIQLAACLILKMVR